MAQVCAGNPRPEALRARDRPRSAYPSGLWRLLRTSPGGSRTVPPQGGCRGCASRGSGSTASSPTTSPCETSSCATSRLRSASPGRSCSRSLVPPCSASSSDGWPTYPSDGIAYPVFVYSGLVIWVYLSGSVSAAAESLVEHREVVTKVFFPRLLAPFASVFPGLLDLAISLVILVGLMIGYGVAPDAALLTLPVWILAAIAVALGAGLWLSALNALYRDVRYTLAFGLQLWLFISPVVFPSSLVEGGWKFVFSLNPAAGVIDGFRWATIGAPKPGVEVLVFLASCLRSCWSAARSTSATSSADWRTGSDGRCDRGRGSREALRARRGLRPLPDDPREHRRPAPSSERR